MDTYKARLEVGSKTLASSVSDLASDGGGIQCTVCTYMQMISFLCPVTIEPLMGMTERTTQRTRMSRWIFWGMKWANLFIMSKDKRAISERMNNSALSVSVVRVCVYVAIAQ